MPIESSPYLFEFRSQNPTGQPGSKGGRGKVFGVFDQDQAAPDLHNRQGYDLKNPQSSKKSVIDVVNKFEWTHTPAEGRHEVPFIRMSEYRVNFNSLIQNIRYLLTAIQPDNINDALNHIGITGAAASVLSAPSKLLDSVRSGFVGNQTGLKPIDSQDSQVAKYLKQYYGLYGATPTGFEYYMPYFEGDYKTVSTSWNDWSQGGGALSNIYSKLFSREGFLRTLTSGSLVSPNAIGAYVERPKQFIYGKDNPSFKFTVDLINTQDVADVVRNWHLVFLLLYQNLPNKTSKLLLEPPVIYEVEIPGTFYSPYAYISNIKVLNVGATRLMKIPVIDHAVARDASAMNSLIYEQQLDSRGTLLAKDPNSGQRKPRTSSFDDDTLSSLRNNGFSNNIQVTDVPTLNNGNGMHAESTVETLIPDAFTIEITIQSLVPDSKNLFYHSTLGHKALTTGIYNETFSDNGMLGVSDADEKTFLRNMVKQDTTVDHWIVTLKSGETLQIRPEDMSKFPFKQIKGTEVIGARNAAGQKVPGVYNDNTY